MSRDKANERKPKATRSVSCQFTYENQTYTSKETLSPIQPEWLKKRLLIEEDDDETKKLKSFRNHHRVSAFSDKTGRNFYTKSKIFKCKIIWYNKT
ncbi:unnamed protein product [Didymodactylos carnosus]|uniref:Uncharacterized protein n=1 Tax=Didymodactylos carnosus TaxID=1234261 RepID=A0A8S2E253_9BILA|nr:unnamed protein product [Didymodactylos carnosus]CAF3797700.1 unnamed protein product [Didymodactylos carnosus]